MEASDQIAPNAELKLLASDIDAAALFELTEWDRFTLDGPITLSLITEGPLANWVEFANASKGSVTLRAADITMNGFALDPFMSDLDTSQFFPFTFDGSSTISVLEAKGQIVSGNIRIEDFSARLANNKISLNGLYAHTAKSLAMAGSIMTINDNGEIDDANTEKRFFVGGAPERPFISPIIPGRLPDQR